MRWKLLIVASLLATVVGAGTCFAARYFLFGPARNFSSPGWLVAATLIVPLAATTYAAIFVYRHTARRRTLQAIATVLFALLLTLAALFFSSFLLDWSKLEVPPAPKPVAHVLNGVSSA